MAWLTYWASFRHNELAYDVFVDDYMSDWDRARTIRQRMLAIDRVIHRWHNDTKQKRERFDVGRPSGVNLIEGSRRQVIEFLDTLSSESANPSAYDRSWREHLERLRARLRDPAEVDAGHACTEGEPG